MRINLRYTLPLMQVALSIALLWWSRELEDHLMGRCDMPGATPAWKILGAISLPTVPGRALWAYISGNFQLGSTAAFLLDGSAYIATIGLLWYGVALNLDS